MADDAELPVIGSLAHSVTVMAHSANGGFYGRCTLITNAGACRRAKIMEQIAMNNLIRDARPIPVEEPRLTISVSPIRLAAPARGLPLELRITGPASGDGLPVVLLSHGHGPSNYIPSKDGYGPLGEQAVVDPQGPADSDRRVTKGCDWFRDARFCRAANRYRPKPEFRSSVIGLRPARTIP